MSPADQASPTQNRAAQTSPEQLERLQAEQALLARCVEGDRAAWRQFVTQYTRYVYHLIRATAQRHQASLSEDAVADLHNDLFLALLEDDHRRLRAYEGKNGCSVRSWIRIITIRRTLDHLRRRRPMLSLDADADESAQHRPYVPEPVDPGPSPLAALIERDAQRRRGGLAKLAGGLSPRDQLLLTLIYDRRMPAPEIATVLNVSVGAIYTRKNRLIQRLRDQARAEGWLDDG